MSSRSSPFDAASSARASSPATSPAPETVNNTDEEEESKATDDSDLKWKQLELVLEKSAMYSHILRGQMERHKLQMREQARPTSHPSKRRKLQEDNEEETSSQDNGQTILFQQPSLITGAKLKDYQLEGLQWMVALHQNGISGILADEMGLGKTLQTIAFCAYLRTAAPKPFLVVCPLSVLHNWIDEFKKFAPGIPVCMYHGTPAERAILRNTVMSQTLAQATVTERQTQKAKQKGRKAKRGKKRAPSPPPEEEKRDYTHEEEEELSKFPVVVTTYEMIINDRAHLEKYSWGYIVVDEGHRLKNMDCKLMQEIKKYSSAGRMVLTGTPLQNNLAELWSLLNFVLPDLFGDMDAFQEWFNLPEMQQNLGSGRSTTVINQLHSILKPFILRRLKVDVETNLPPKKEYVLFAPLTVHQRGLYDAILNKSVREFLLKKRVTLPNGKSIQTAVDVDAPRKLRKKKESKGAYAVDGDDDEYFDKLEDGDEPVKYPQGDDTKDSRQYEHIVALKRVNNMKLQNTVMQLRKVCSHPYLFDWPLDSKTHQPLLNAELVNSSGKMLILDRLLTELFARGHKVLLFSQFTTMLDILQDWAVEFKGWDICRIDGSTGPSQRRDEMARFQNGGDDGPKLFLLSTRAGGMGINLTAADTVIFYEQDWNPQMDAQAQDRAHRIGQTKPVLVFRLVTDHSIETKIMQKAGDKKRLEAIVIAKGKFKAPTKAAAASKNMAELAASLLKLEGEKIKVVEDTNDVIKDEYLEKLLDRSPEVFADRGAGWASDEKDKSVFAVYQQPTIEGESEALAGLFGEALV